ncbi:MAG: endo-1,4-beta-xylanase [Planctomycetota bacterium]|nr:endo-1,4-beta-xylanase [Planctomycetota bacterium]MDP7251043.1 endo-1,4-beta-xylanase [Planctomycetota bacterium]
MRRRNDWFALVLLLAPGLHGAEPPIPEGRRIREIVADKYPEGNVYVGGTTGWRKRPRGSGLTMDREFSYVTPENDFKLSTIHPKPDVWKWELADKWVAHCAKAKQVLRMHGPISPQCSTWAKTDTRTSEELRQCLTDFMTRLCKRYDKYEHVKWMDVVNETVLQNGKWFGPREGTTKWENPWPKIGYDTTHPLKPPLYIKLAFEIATKHAPNTKLIINQHAGMEDAAWKKIKALVAYLRGKELRVDGIGWQAHIHVGWEKKKGNLTRLSQLIDWAHANDLSFHVTEQNVWLKGKEKDYEAQAETFAAILRALLEKRDGGIVTWNVWNLSDGDSWKKMEKLDGCLFDRQYKPKPAYYALQRLLENPPATARE